MKPLRAERFERRHRDELYTAAERAAWLLQLERLTADHRERRALEFEAMGDEVKAKDPSADVSWYVNAARGVRQRFDSVRDCGKKGVVKTTCGSCGHVHKTDMRCSFRLLCDDARQKHLRKQRRRLVDAWTIHLDHARACGLFSSRRSEGAWSLKFLSVTMPKRGVQDPSRRVEIVDEAFKRFVRRMLDYFREQGLGLTDPIPWVAAWEWTAGADGLGHPHFHVQILCPWLPRKELHAWWVASLVEAGYPLVPGEPVLCPNVAAVADLERSVRELCKYITKDVACVVKDSSSEYGALVEPRIFATLLMLRTGRRALRTSRGFWSVLEKRHGATCRQCKSKDVKVRHHRKSSEADRAAAEGFRRMVDALRSATRGHEE